ncbi:acyl-CoA synthetase [Svornostia abyssi]|uniref:Acyl-CoA synthetase n=1 Tax=Svornostia abyssi TaxID=2898438 RepID=A0ABY5PH34_9ACTN|nr:acyl-CoA synthetase [Parviterribacteraceae bacterium J379]
MTQQTADLLWPVAYGPQDLEAIEAVPLSERGLPASTYAALARAAELWPDRTATICLPDAARWEEPSERTFSELLADVHRVAGVFCGFGIGRRDAVALVAPNCEELLTAVLAAETAGIAAPINPGLAAEHVVELVRLAGAHVIVAAGPELDPAAWEVAREAAQAVSAVALLALRPTGATGAPAALAPLPGVEVGYLGALAAAQEDLAPASPAADDLASYIHTGGTTGTPKLAARTHRSEVANAWMIASASELGQDGVVFAALPLFHTNALIVTVLAPLLRGQPVLWAGPLGYRDLPLYGVFWRMVERYGIALMSGVPTVYAVLAQVPVDADISSLRLPIVGAAPLPPSVAEQFHAVTGVELSEGYGLTEGTCATARDWPGAPRRGTVGQRLPYQEVRAVRIDEVTGAWEDLPPGEVGTLVIRGPNVFAGYLWHGPVPDPGDKVRDGWLDTGDIGAVDEEGYVRLAGRAKDLIIRGGHNIDPAVIEDALLEHDAVLAAGAVGRPDAHAGEVPVAYVQVVPGAVTEDELVAWAADRVPERAAAPKLVEIIDEIPLTLVGKPFKPELRRRATERVAREVIGSAAAQVTARLEDGAVVVEVDGAADLGAVEHALAPFAVSWRVG